MSQVRKLRESLGMTQKEMADILNTSQPTLSKWESGEEPAEDSLHFRLQILYQTWEDGLPRWRDLVMDLYRWRLGVARGHMEGVFND